MAVWAQSQAPKKFGQLQAKERALAQLKAARRVGKVWLQDTRVTSLLVLGYGGGKELGGGNSRLAMAQMSPVSQCRLVVPSLSLDLKQVALTCSISNLASTVKGFLRA